MGDETIVAVANLIGVLEDHGHPVGLDQGVVGVVGGDEPVPLRVREEVMAGGVVRRRIRAAEEPGDQGRRHVEVGGAAIHPSRRPPGPANEQRSPELGAGEAGAVAVEAQSVLVELHAVIGSHHEHGVAEQLAPLQIVEHPGIAFKLMTVLSLTTGTAFIMWLGEQITERGVGNGMSLIIFAGIVVGFPRGLIDTFQKVATRDISLFSAILLVAMMLLVVAVIVFVERGQRRITVQYAKRVVGRRMYGGQSTHLPLRVNTSGVIPVIFASSIITFPQTIAQMLQANSPWMQSVYEQLRWGMPLYNLLYVTFIIFFCYFYTAIVFNPDDVAENMRKYGGFVPGIRPGKRTAEYLEHVMFRVTLAGGAFLVVIAVLPQVLSSNVPNMPVEMAVFLGGTSILIVVGVVLDLVDKVNSMLVMRRYEGLGGSGAGWARSAGKGAA